MGHGSSSEYGPLKTAKGFFYLESKGSKEDGLEQKVFNLQ